MDTAIAALGQNALKERPLDYEEALLLIEPQGPEEIFELLFWANQIRHRFQGKAIDLCAIVNAKSGRCSEDCAFCAQSAHYAAQAPAYPLMGLEEMLAAADRAAACGASRFSLVTSGRGITNSKELEQICRAVSALTQTGRLRPCASLGLLTPETAATLRKAGLVRYHHNIETAPSFYPSICRTHSIEARLGTIRQAQAAGLEVCSGGILGLGETWEQRVEMAFTLRDLGVDSVALNFLNPIPGTPLAGREPLPPLEILKSIALFRFILPRADVRTCGGREKGLRTLQPLMYLAGCNGTMVGNYLTTEGRDPKMDRQEIIDLGLVPGTKTD
jgi:biotin synthase